jgi:hypothetical protein
MKSQSRAGRPAGASQGYRVGTAVAAGAVAAADRNQRRSRLATLLGDTRRAGTGSCLHLVSRSTEWLVSSRLIPVLYRALFTGLIITFLVLDNDQLRHYRWLWRDLCSAISSPSVPTATGALNVDVCVCVCVLDDGSRFLWPAAGFAL